MKLLIEHCDVIDPQAPRSTKTDQSILVKGRRIAAIGDPAGVARLARAGGADAELQTIDGRRFLAIPGLISAHTHSPENFMRGAVEGMPLEPWLVWLYSTCGVFTPRDHYLAAAMSAIEMLLSGCTSSFDHVWHGGPWSYDLLAGAMQAYRDSGMRATVAPLYNDHDVVLDVGDALGFNLRRSVYGMAHSGDAASRRARLIANLDIFDDWMTDWHGEGDGRLQAFLGPAAGQLVSADCLHMSLDLARKHGAGMQMHCVETRLQDYCIRRSHEGRTVIHWMHDEGVLGPDVSLPHSVWIRSEADLSRLAETGAIPVHNPAANLKLGSGLMPMREMLDHGITVALGVDGACSNDNQNLFETIKLAALIHNVKDHDPKTWISAREAFEAATHGGAAVMLMQDDLGVLLPGKLADIVLLDERSPAISPVNDACRLLAYCETGASVAHVIVNGEIVVKDRKIVTFDAAAIEQEFRERAGSFPFRRELDAKTKQDVADVEAFWRHIMGRVNRGE